MGSREAPDGQHLESAVAEAVLDAIRSVRYGSVEVVIHDGRVVGIERREKVKVDKGLGR